MKKMHILSGAGVSAESGLKTFRSQNGLWENHDISKVATLDAWQRNPEVVLRFYNKRRRKVLITKPNEGHKIIGQLEKDYDITVITQNVDDLHERAGSTQVIHLHGELLKVRSTIDESIILDWKKDLVIGDYCPLGSQLRPHIVWFGEEVPMFSVAAHSLSKADIILLIGTSLQVYPAASLINYAPPSAQVYYIDPYPSINNELAARRNVHIIEKVATEGMIDFREMVS